MWRLARVEFELRTRALRCIDACAAVVFGFASRAQVSNLVFEKFKKLRDFWGFFARVEKTFWRLARVEFELRSRALRCIDACAALVFDFASRAQVSNLIFEKSKNLQDFLPARGKLCGDLRAWNLRCARVQ